MKNISMIKNSKHSIYVLFFVASLFIAALHSSSAHAESFNPGRIIDDGVFVNKSTMNPSQIQAFLNSKVPNCDTNGTQQSEYGGGTRAQWAQAKYGQSTFTCLKNYSENGRSAAQLIFDKAQAYSINPQVLIVLLQKEQGLVTDTWPLNIQYRSATGYGCPDTAPCDSQYYGLNNQLDWAAKMFRAIINASPTWYTPYIVGNNYIRYNPVASCGGSTVNISNRSTQALYNYTPYQPNAAALAASMGSTVNCGAYGNLNFYRYYTAWFGSTQFPQPNGGSLYYQQSTGGVYLVNDSTRYYIPSMDTLRNYSLDRYPMISATDADIQNFTDGGALTNLTWDDGGVYLVNNGSRYHVSGDMCTAWALTCFDGSKVKALGSAFQTQHLQQGGELSNLSYSNGAVYRMLNGQRQPIANPKTLTDLGLSSTPIIPVSTVNSQQPLGILLMTTPGVIQFSSDTPIYYFDGTNYYQVPDMNSYFDWSLNRVTQLSGPVSLYNTTLPNSTNLTPWALSEGKKYIIDQGRKLLIPDSLQSLWSNKSFTVQPTPLLNSLPNETISSLIWTNPSIFLLDNGAKRHVSSPADLSALQASIGSITSMKQDKVAATPDGAVYIGDGGLVSLSDGSGKIYVVNNRKLTLIPNPDIFNAYKFDWGAVQSFPPSLVNDYPLDTQTLGSSVASDGTHYVVAKSNLYRLSSSDARDFGAIDNKFISINKIIIPKNITTMTRFLYNSDNGGIYYASGEAIHHIMNFNAYRVYGGTSQPLIAADTNTLQLFIETQPLN